MLEDSQRKAVQQLRKLRELMTGRLLSALDAETRRLLRTALSDDSLRVLRPEDFPASLVAGFRERNGQLARTVLVCPKLTQRTWEGPRIREFTEAGASMGHLWMEGYFGVGDPLVRQGEPEPSRETGRH